MKRINGREDLYLDNKNGEVYGRVRRASCLHQGLRVLLTAAGMVLLLSLQGCNTLPAGIKPVESFELERYLGSWYEIARLDNSFEKGLSQVTADYSLRDDGGIKVVNRGFNAEKAEWEEAVGKGYFVGPPTVGQLKVSFFGPFYAGYNVIAVDNDYKYAMVCGSDRSYLWILARTDSLDQQVLDRLIAQAKAQGFATDELLFVEH